MIHRLLVALVAVFVFSLSISAQVESKWFVVGNVTGGGSVGGGFYNATISLAADQSGNGYNGNSVAIGNRLISSSGRLYAVTAINSPGSFFTVDVQLESLEAIDVQPLGTIVLYDYTEEDPFIPLGATNSIGVSPAFAAIIVNHNFRLATTGVPSEAEGDPLYVLASGQSNMDGNGLGGDVTPNPNVFAWDYVADQWNVATIGSEPFETVNGYNNLAFHFCKKLQEETGRPVYLLLSAQGSQAISEWVPGTSPQWVSLVQRVTEAGITNFDYFLWHQGEQDSGSTPAAYEASWNVLKEQLRAESWFSPTTPIIAGELWPGGSGDTQNAFITTMNSDGDEWTSYGAADASTMNSPDNVHYDGPSLVLMGREQYWAAAMSLPSYSSSDGSIGTVDQILPENRDLDLNGNDWYIPGGGKMLLGLTDGGITAQDVKLQVESDTGQKGIHVQAKSSSQGSYFLNSGTGVSVQSFASGGGVSGNFITSGHSGSTTSGRIMSFTRQQSVGSATNVLSRTSLSTTGTVGAGFGGYHDYLIEGIGTSGSTALRWGTNWTDPNSGTLASRVFFNTRGVTNELSPQFELYGDIGGVERAVVTGDISVTGGFRDSDGDIGTLGQLLSSTLSGTDWVDPAEGLTSASFGLSDDDLTLTSNGVDLTATLRPISLSPSAVFVSETGYSTSPELGNLRKTFSQNDASLLTYGASKDLVFLPGRHTITSSFNDVQTVSTVRGAFLDFQILDPFGVQAGNDYDFRFGNVKTVGSFNGEGGARNIDLVIERLESNGVWWEGRDVDRANLRIGTWIQTSNYGMYIARVGKSFLAQIDYVNDTRTTTVGASAMFTYNFAHQANDGTRNRVEIETFEWAPEKPTSNTLGHGAFRFGVNTNSTFTGTDNYYELSISNLIDNSTGTGCTGCDYYQNYISLSPNQNSGISNTIALMRPPNTAGNTLTTRILAGSMRSPVMVLPMWNFPNSTGATDLTINILLGNIDVYNDAAVVVDPPTSATGVVNIKGDNVVQNSTKPLIKIGQNDMEYHIFGRWEVKGASPLIYTNGEDLHLYDVELVNQGGGNLIEANSQVTVYCYGGTYIPENRVNSNITIVYLGGKPGSGPIGETGPAGADGPAGPAGADGADGGDNLRGRNSGGAMMAQRIGLGTFTNSNYWLVGDSKLNAVHTASKIQANYGEVYGWPGSGRLALSTFDNGVLGLIPRATGSTRVEYPAEPLARYSMCGQAQELTGTSEVRIEANSNYITYTENDTCTFWDYAKIYYVRHPSGGDVDVFVDDVLITTLDANGVEAKMSYEITGLTDAPHTLKLKNVSGTNYTLEGIFLRQNKEGVIVNFVANSGYTAAEFNTLFAFPNKEILNDYPPHKIGVRLGTNESNNDLLPATFVDGVESVVDVLLLASPNADVILFGHEGMGLSTVYEDSDYLSALKNKAISRYWSYYSLSEVVPDFADFLARGFASDNAHENADGSHLIGNAIFRASETMGLVTSGESLQSVTDFGNTTSNPIIVNSWMDLRDANGNMRLGDRTGEDLTSGMWNYLMGYQSGLNITEGDQSILLGYQSGYRLTTGDKNVFIGTQSGFNNKTGSFNFGLGSQAAQLTNAGASLNTVNNSIYIGSLTRAFQDNVINEIVIGHNGRGNGSNTATFGNALITDTYLFGDTHVEEDLTVTGEVSADSYVGITISADEENTSIDGGNTIPSPNAYNFNGTFALERVMEGFLRPGGTERSALYFGRDGFSSSSHTGFEAIDDFGDGFKLDSRTGDAGNNISASLFLSNDGRATTLSGYSNYYTNGVNFYGFDYHTGIPRARVGALLFLDRPSTMPAFDRVVWTSDKDGSGRMTTLPYKVFAIRNTTLTSQSFSTDTDLTLTLPGGNYTVEAVLVFECNSAVADFMYRLAASGAINSGQDNGYISAHSSSLERLDFNNTFGETVRTSTANGGFQVTITGTIKFFSGGGTIAVQRGILDNSGGKECLFRETSSLTATPQYGNQ